MSPRRPWASSTEPMEPRGNPGRSSQSPRSPWIPRATLQMEHRNQQALLVMARPLGALTNHNSKAPLKQAPNPQLRTSSKQVKKERTKKERKKQRRKMEPMEPPEPIPLATAATLLVSSPACPVITTERAALATPTTFLAAPPAEPPVPLGRCSSTRKRSEQMSG